jgi:methyl-accepting chemotaxis protein
MLSAPLKDIENEANVMMLFVRKIIIASTIFLVIIVFVFTLSIVIPLQRLTKIMLKLSLGQVSDDLKIDVKINDELGDMANSMNTVIKGMSDTTGFAESIGKGKFDYNYKPLSDKDALGNAILEMRNSLNQAQSEEEQRRLEEEQLNWASHGINIFNKVLRVDNQNLEHLSFEIIKTLTLYLDAQMGGLYIKSDEKNQVELTAHLGFAKEKYTQRIIEGGQALIGRAILEKETIFINEIPKDADLICSGLGKSKPKAILIVPLIYNLNLIGIIEIESLNDILPYQIAFVERIVETIAATISTVKTNERTATLLEKSRKQAEELEQQEEEMRQNMEEMQATQEEAAKRELELSSFIQTFLATIPIMEYDIKGRVTDVNDEYIKIYKTRKNHLLGKQHKADLFMNEHEQAKHDEFWENLRRGKIMEQVEFIKSGKEDFWILERFVPIIESSGIINKIMAFGIDITEQKKTESKIQQIRDGHLIIEPGKKARQKSKKNPAVNFSQEFSLIDLTYLKMVYKKDAQKIYNILKLYHDSLPNQVKELGEVLNKRDYKGLKIKTSALKTKMSYLGLKKIYESLGAIERLIVEDKNLVEIPKLLNSINQQWQKAYEELSLIINANQ